jgi:hypothetical protein
MSGKATISGAVPGDQSETESQAAVGEKRTTKLSGVNTTNIPDAIRLGCRTVYNVFNWDEDDIPFFGPVVWPEARVCFTSDYSEDQHVLRLGSSQHQR